MDPFRVCSSAREKNMFDASLLEHFALGNVNTQESVRDLELRYTISLMKRFLQSR